MTKARNKNPGAGKFLDAEEKALHAAIEREGFTPKSMLKSSDRNTYAAAARARLNESRVKISLRIPESDILLLKAKAMREGMPYQTLIGSILHKAVSRRGRSESEPPRPNPFWQSGKQRLPAHMGNPRA